MKHRKNPLIVPGLSYCLNAISVVKKTFAIENKNLFYREKNGDSRTFKD